MNPSGSAPVYTRASASGSPVASAAAFSDAASKSSSACASMLSSFSLLEKSAAGVAGGGAKPWVRFAGAAKRRTSATARSHCAFVRRCTRV
jgi:hypothetical protein